MNLACFFNLLFCVIIPAIVKGELKGAADFPNPNPMDGIKGAVYVYEPTNDAICIDLYDVPLDYANANGTPPAHRFVEAGFLRGFDSAIMSTVASAGERPTSEMMPDSWPPKPEAPDKPGGFCGFKS